MPKYRKIVPLKFDAYKEGSRLIDRHFEHAAFGVNYAVGVSRPKLVKSHGFDQLCPYCTNELARIDYEASNDETGTRSWNDICTDCGFWRNRLEDNVYADQVTFPVSKSFNQENNLASISFLSHALLANPEQIYSTDPIKFEILIGSIISDQMDCDVHHVGGVADGGVDLIALVSDAPCLIQVKRRGNEGAIESIDTVKLLFASAFAQGADRGMVVTSARDFSKPAKKWARELSHLETPFEMNLASMNSILEMIDATSKGNTVEFPLRTFEMHKEREREFFELFYGKEWKWIEVEGGDLLVHSIDKKEFDVFLVTYRDIENAYYFRVNDFSSFEEEANALYNSLAMSAKKMENFRTSSLFNFLPWELYDQMVRKWPFKFDGALTIDGDF